MTRFDPTPTRWRCPRCHTLLGVATAGGMEVRYKAARYLIQGRVTAWCRRCGTEAIFDAGASRGGEVAR